MVAHKHYVLESILDHLLGDLFVHSGKKRRSEADSARQRGACVIRGERQNRSGDGVAQLFGDRDDCRVRHQRMTSVDVLRAPMFGAAVINQRGGLAGLDRLLDLRPGHHFEVDFRLRERRSGE